MRPIAPHGRGARFRLWLVMTAALAATALPTGNSPSRALADDDDARAPGGGAPAVATVGDVVLTTADLERIMRRRAGGRMAPDDPAERGRAMADLVDETILRAEVERRGIAASEREIDDRVAALSQDLATRKSSLDAFLADQKIDRMALRGRLALDIALTRLAASLLTPEAMKRAYEAHHRDFDGTRLRVAHIVLRPDGSDGTQAIPALAARARKIRDSIVAGEMSFAEAAARHSAGPSRHRGGDIGFIPRHGQLSEDFAQACFAVRPGEVSQPILTPYGIHLISVLEVDAGSVAADQFRPQLERVAAQDEVRSLLKECRERTTVTVEPGYEIATEPLSPPAP